MAFSSFSGDRGSRSLSSHTEGKASLFKQKEGKNQEWREEVDPVLLKNDGEDERMFWEGGKKN